MTSRFVYVTYIHTTPADVWDALTKPEFTRQYWFGVTLETTWKKGGSWQMVFPDGTVTDEGEIVQIKPRARLVLKWQHVFYPEMKAEGFSRCTFDIAKQGDTTRLTVTHEIDRDEAKIIEAVADGWPKILSGLKSLLETDSPIDIPLGSASSSRRRKVA